MTPMILLVMGPRPEVIKLAPVYWALRARQDAAVWLCYVNQSPDLGPALLAEFDLAPDDWVDLPPRGDTLDDLMAHALPRVGHVLDRVRPALVLVQGDTTTTLGAALAAAYRHIPVGHVEAGLRTPSRTEPHPEELHRRLVSRLAAVHFAPTAQAARALCDERAEAPHDEQMSPIYITGNPVVDMLRRIPLEPRAEAPRRVLVTCHRREAWPERLPLLVDAVRRLADTPGLRIDWCAHPNPTIAAAVRPLQGLPGVTVHPHGATYSAFVGLVQAAHLVLTDSGGAIEEATTLGRPLLILRDATERPEALAAGAQMVPLAAMRQPAAFAAQVRTHVEAGTPRVRATDVFGDGGAGPRIAELAVDYCRRARQP